MKLYDKITYMERRSDQHFALSHKFFMALKDDICDVEWVHHPAGHRQLEELIKDFVYRKFVCVKAHEFAPNGQNTLQLLMQQFEADIIGEIRQNITAATSDRQTTFLTDAWQITVPTLFAQWGHFADPNLYGRFVFQQ